jgi:predicted N-acetyltransferase YhbS
MGIEIRRERPEGAAGLRRVLLEAVGQPDEARIVDAIREGNNPVISLVALTPGALAACSGTARYLPEFTQDKA